jgi:hypothetical protein
MMIMMMMTIIKVSHHIKLTKILIRKIIQKLKNCFQDW